jgi:hypothetical protein
MKRPLFELIILTAIMPIYALSVFGQVDSLKIHVSQLKKKHLVYYSYSDPFGKLTPKYHSKDYGFTIQFTDSVWTKEFKKADSIATGELNRVFGENWFDRNRCNFLPNLCDKKISGHIYAEIYRKDSSQKDKIPVVNAKISAIDYENKVIGEPVYSDSSGYYEMVLWTYGKFQKIEKEGFKVMINQTDYRPIKTFIWDVTLSPADNDNK